MNEQQVAVDRAATPFTDAAIDQLGIWLKATIGSDAGLLTISRLAGGQSNPTYRVDTASSRYVLRCRPAGRVLASAHAIDREYRVLDALHPTGFSVPRPIALCMDDGVIGSSFYLMELVEGRTLWDGDLPGMTPVDRTAVYHELVDTLAALHRIDPATVGLGDYSRPGNYFTRQVGRWIGQYRAAETEMVPAMERLIDWLPSSVPDQDRIAIVHGDFRIDNLIFATDTPRILALLDWELSTLGDPLADLAYLLLNWLPEREARSAVGRLDLASLGIPRLEDMIARYAERTGRTTIPDLSWYFAFNLFRLAAIVQGIKKRVADGTAAAANAADVASRVPQLAGAGWIYAQSAGA